MKLNRDDLNHVSPEEVAQGALGILDRVSDSAPEPQVVALAAAFIVFLRRIGASVPAEDIMTVARNVLGSNSADGPSFNALRSYALHEL